MKTIQITSKGQTDYIINLNQITHLHEDIKESGTWIILSCGKKIITDIRIYDLLELIKKKYL